jgi:hypothetical protein
MFQADIIPTEPPRLHSQEPAGAAELEAGTRTPAPGGGRAQHPLASCAGFSVTDRRVRGARRNGSDGVTSGRECPQHGHNEGVCGQVSVEISGCRCNQTSSMVEMFLF